MKNQTTIAIDPGASGGIAVKFPNGSVTCEPMPTTEGDILALLTGFMVFSKTENLPIVCHLEDLVKHMGAGIPASTMAVYASNWGYIKGAVMALGVRLELVSPQEWQKGLGLAKARKDKNSPPLSSAAKSAAKREWKDKLKGEAQRLYPQCAVTLKTADALLILEHATRPMEGK
jgi:hypothetical protein